ncbi:hypothetical protein AAFF_G00248640 [Aldrovandia affinis]|uniref:Uncharacterized protein n=1 Tax=Aldrovandia affinis TaxID=143900 RepID=A0AAD7RD55_9TELE|nr:hypothetical protein AAFF_G00248640 [Aldrovandia affinis]
MLCHHGLLGVLTQTRSENCTQAEPVPTSRLFCRHLWSAVSISGRSRAAALRFPLTRKTAGSGSFTLELLMGIGGLFCRLGLPPTPHPQPKCAQGSSRGTTPDPEPEKTSRSLLSAQLPHRIRHNLNKEHCPALMGQAIRAPSVDLDRAQTGLLSTPSISPQPKRTGNSL